MVTWVGVSEAAFELPESATLRWYASSPKAQRGFCSDCGSTLFFRSSRWPGEIHIVRANLQAAIDREPSGHAYWENRAPWLQLGDELPRGDGGD